jgi:hypothetical protein
MQRRGQIVMVLAWASVCACGTTAAPGTRGSEDARDAGASSGAPEAASVDSPREAEPRLDSPVTTDTAVDRTAIDMTAAAETAREVGATETLPPESDGGPAALRCNGSAALCDRRFNEVVYPAAHNAMSNSDDGWIAADQVHGIARQLNDGIRAMLIDSYAYLGDAYLCHASCLLGSKRLADSLGEMVTFLKQNPNEVLTLIFEDYITAAETNTAFMTSGLDKLVYTHASGSQWPTLRAMIESNQRVFVGAQTASPPPAWYHHFYDLAWDTPYAFKTLSDFSCAQNRGKTQNDLFLLNHWLENPLPSQTLSAMANTREVLLGRAMKCKQESGKLPNFVAVSHYSIGDLFDVVRTLNGL